MSTNLPFPLADFYDALVSKNVKEKLQPFIAQFRKKNTYVVYESVNRLIQILTNRSELPIMKFNALMATRYFFDTCEYAAVSFIEVFMLPVIYEIALQKYLKRSQQGIQLYFVDRGAQNTKEIRRLGLNYVQLAAELIFNCAKVKPYRLIENKQLKEESNFVRTVRVLNSKGIQQPQKCIYYIPSYPLQTRKKFLKKLKHLSPEPYISFLVSEYLEEINLNKKCDLDIKKLLLFGDSFLTSTMVEIIEEELSRMSTNFINKKKYLNLLNDLIRSGEIQSIYLVNTTDFVRQIADQICKVKGNGGPQQGEYIYPKIQASKQEKKEFYLEFLRVIEIWAHCMPVTDEGEQSQVLKIYEQMKKKNFSFPKNVILNKIKQEMEENLVINQERNETLMKLIDQDDRASSRHVGSYISSKGQFRFHFPDYKEKTSYLELDQLQYKVFETKKKIARLAIKKEELKQNMEFIANFAKNWQEDLETLDIEDEDPHELQILVDEGDLCCQQYEKVLPFYQDYKKEKLTYDQFCKKIQFLETLDEVESDDGRTSQVSHNRKTLQQSQHMQSSLSQSVRKRIQDEYFTAYGHHYQRQEKSISVKSKNLMDQKSVSAKNQKFNENIKFANQDKQKSQNSQYESQNPSKISSRKNLREEPGKKKEINLKQELKLSESRRVTEKRSQKDNYSNLKYQQNQNQYAVRGTQRLEPPLQKSTRQKFDQSQPSQISSSSQQNQSSLQSSRHIERLQEKQQIQYRTENLNTVSVNLQSSESDFKLQTKEHIHQRCQSPEYIELKPSKKSYVNHSVISKSSYHSQPTEPKINQSGFHEGNSMMNDYEYDNAPYVTNAGVTVKKSSIKRTENSALKSSSHKKIQQIPTPRPSQAINDAVSPFKKKKSSLSKDLKVREQFQFVKSNKKLQTKKISDQITYDDVFRRNNDLDKSKNESEISSESESVVKKRNNKLMKQEAMRETARMNLNDQSEYYNENKQSVLKRSTDSKFKRNSKTPSKNIILFDSNHQSPKRQTVQKLNQDYEMKSDDNKIKNLTDKKSENSKNASKLASGLKVKSGIKIVSKNEYKSFDSLYKNEYNNVYGQSGSKPINHRYIEVTSEYNNQLQASHTKNSQNPQINTFSPEQKSSVIQNQDYSPVCLEEVNQELQKYKTKTRNIHTHHDVSEIHQPQNMPMLYSHCSEKSIHSRMTDSHTRKGNSSNYNEFRACFQNMDKEVLPLNLIKSKAVSSSFSLDKAKNFIDLRCSNVKSSSKFTSVVDAISEKNAKNSILLYKLERQKTRLVENLQNKIKEMEVNGKMMKTKYALKDQSVRENLQSRQHSQPEVKLSYPDSKTSRQSSNQNLSSYDLLKKSKKPSDSPTNSQHQGLTPLTLNKTLINTKNYEPFFSSFLKTTSKKTLYKKKGLLVKNDEIEIGYMITKKDKYCLVSVFVTPYISSIKNVQVDVECDNNLAAKVKPGRVEKIQAKKQEIIICNFSVQNVPFKLPIINLTFDQNPNYKKNSYTLGLPCTILSFSQLNTDSLGSVDMRRTDSGLTLRTEIFKLSKKICKAQKLKQILLTFKQSKRENKVTKFEGVIKYQSYECFVSIALNDSGYVLVEGWSLDQQGQNVNFLEYLLSTKKFMLEEEEN